MKYADLVMTWLSEMGYTRCFFVAGGNSMHLLDGARKTMRCTPFVHEVAAGIAAEYFNEIADAEQAFVLVTAGPGMTNLITAMAGAYLESRELLVLGGQVKSTDLAGEALRQRGIQEVDGLALAAPVSKVVARIEQPVDRATLVDKVQIGSTGRKGPVFLEFCLDAQGAPVTPADLETVPPPPAPTMPSAEEALEQIAPMLEQAARPVLLIGGGIDRTTASAALEGLTRAGVPLMTTWNGADRVPAQHPLFCGRPNTWGQRSSNVLLQQADLIIALGTRLGLQQTGFNWQQFAPVGRLVQVELDPAELAKGHPRVDVPLLADANAVLDGIAARPWPVPAEWVGFCRDVRARLPVSERTVNTHRAGYLDPFDMVLALSARCRDDDVVVPCSSGGAFTVMMQAFEQQAGQIVVTDKGLASMGYGLSGAIGAALAHPERRVVLVEGDGGFAQNLQELATVGVNDLNLKIFLFANEGYASIRMTQRNYFDGQYLGCDTATGLGFPHWDLLAEAYSIPYLELSDGFESSAGFAEVFDAPGPALIVVPIDPEQTYFPKISSRVTATGSMESAPLHLMSPELPEALAAEVLQYLPPALRS